MPDESGGGFNGCAIPMRAERSGRVCLAIGSSDKPLVFAEGVSGGVDIRNSSNNLAGVVWDANAS